MNATFTLVSTQSAGSTGRRRNSKFQAFLLRAVWIGWVCAAAKLVAQPILDPRPGWVCPNGQNFDTCTHDCKFRRKYDDGRFSRKFDAGCCQADPGSVPCQDYRPNLRFGATEDQTDDGLVLNYFVDYWDLEDWENPVISMYWENEATGKTSVVFVKTLPIEKGAGEHKLLINRATLNTAPRWTRRIRLTLDSNKALTERDESDNTASVSMPVRQFDLSWVGMRSANVLRVVYRQDFGDPSVTRWMHLTTRINGRPIDSWHSGRNTSYPDPGTGAFEIDLAAAGVPRFQENVVFDLVVTLGQMTRTRRVAIPLPTILVPGIDPQSAITGNPHVRGGNRTFDVIEDSLSDRLEAVYGPQAAYPTGIAGTPATLPYCYLVNIGGTPSGFSTAPDSGTEKRPYYPMLHTLSLFGMTEDRNTVGFAKGGELLDQAIDTMRSRTYADRVNLVAHSKGCLLSRAMLARNYSNGLKVRNLIMIQGPHLGAIAAIDPTASKALANLSRYPKDVYRSLAPIWKFFKRADEPVKSGRFHTYPGFENPELARLDRRELPSHSGVSYTILYSRAHRTAYTMRGGTVLGSVFSWGGGDGIVPEFSQRGYRYDPDNRYKYNPKNPNILIGLIPAFIPAARAGSINWIPIDEMHTESTVSLDVAEQIWNTLWSSPVVN